MSITHLGEIEPVVAKDVDVRGIRLQGLSVVLLCMHGQWLSAETVDEDACAVSVDYGRNPCTGFYSIKITI